MAIEKEYTLKLSTKQAQENVDELNKSLEAQTDLIDDIEKEIREYEKQLKKTSKKDLAARKSVNDKIKETKERLKDEKVALKDVTKEQKKANQTLKEATDNQVEYSGVLGLVDNQLGGAISKMTGITKAVGGATKGFKLMRIAIIGTGIGALVIALTSLGAAFTASEEGQNKFTKMMNTISVVTGNVVDILANLGEGIFAIGKALVKLASGDLAGASAAWGEMKENINEVTDGIKNFGEETQKEIGVMNKLSDARAYADKLERKLIIERAEADRKRADLLEKAVDKEKYNLQERIGFLNEAAQVEEDITNKEIEAARIRFETKAEQNKLSKSTKEDLDEEAELQARLIELETAKLRKAKLVTTQISALRKEARAEQKAADDEEKKKIEEEIQLAASNEEKRLAAIKAITDKYKLEEQKTEVEKLEIEKEKRLKELDDLNAHFIQKAAIAKFYDEKISAEKDKINITSTDNSIKFSELETEAKLQIVGNMLSQSATLVDEQSAAGKAIAIATTGINTTMGVMQAIANLPPPVSYIAAGISGAMGLMNVQKIISTPIPSASGRGNIGGGGSTPSMASIPSAPPSFNVVGTSGTNQLADAIGGQEQQPVQAFVVASDVSTAQELDRNIIEGASIG